MGRSSVHHHQQCTLCQNVCGISNILHPPAHHCTTSAICRRLLLLLQSIIWQEKGIRMSNGGGSSCRIGRSINECCCWCCWCCRILSPPSLLLSSVSSDAAAADVVALFWSVKWAHIFSGGSSSCGRWDEMMSWGSGGGGLSSTSSLTLYSLMINHFLLPSHERILSLSPLPLSLSFRWSNWR